MQNSCNSENYHNYTPFNAPLKARKTLKLVRENLRAEKKTHKQTNVPRWSSQVCRRNTRRLRTLRRTPTHRLKKYDAETARVRDRLNRRTTYAACIKFCARAFSRRTSDPERTATIRCALGVLKSFVASHKQRAYSERTHAFSK